VWFGEDAPPPSAHDESALLDKANAILAELMRDHEIVRTWKLPPGSDE
jgi:hypothetical protein